MFSFFGLVIGIFSVLFSRTFGLLGLLMPSALVGFGYLLVDTIIVELYYINQNHNRRL
jgi:hypothetical protein